MVLSHSPNSVQMGAADSSDFFMQELQISILNHPAHFTRFHNSRARQMRRRGIDRGRQEGETDSVERVKVRERSVPEGALHSLSSFCLSLFFLFSWSCQLLPSQWL